MGLKKINVHQNGKDYEYWKFVLLLNPEKHNDVIRDLLRIPEAEQKDEIIKRIEAGSMREQIKAVLSEILGSSTITLPAETKETAISALHSLGGLY